MAMVDVDTIAAYRWTYGSRQIIGLVQRAANTCAVLHSSHKPGELSQWLCRDDSTINIVTSTIIITSNVPGLGPGTFTPAQRPGHYRGCSVLRYLRPRNLAVSFAAATGTAGVTAALRRSQSACCACARSANQRHR